MRDQALTATKRITAVQMLCEQAGITLTDDERSAINEAVNTAWDQQGEQYEKIGVAKESLRKMQEFNTYAEKHFESIYGAEGSQAVSDEEVEKYFKENYGSIKYFAVSLTDSSGNELGAEDQERIETELGGVKQSYEEGEKTFSEIVDEYNEKHSTATVTMRESISDLKTNFSEEFYKEIENVEPGKAAVFTYNNYMYVVAVYDVEKETDYLENNASEIRHTMRDEQYTQLMEAEEEKINFTINEAAINKYSPNWLEKQLG